MTQHTKGRDCLSSTAETAVYKSCEKQYTSMAHRNTGKVAVDARSKELQMGPRLFGC